jgi:hypothetical protein
MRFMFEKIAFPKDSNQVPGVSIIEELIPESDYPPNKFLRRIRPQEITFKFEYLRDFGTKVLKNSGYNSGVQAG